MEKSILIPEETGIHLPLGGLLMTFPYPGMKYLSRIINNKWTDIAFSFLLLSITPSFHSFLPSHSQQKHALSASHVPDTILGPSFLLAFTLDIHIRPRSVPSAVP